MGLFSDLDKLGIKQFKNVDVYQDKKEMENAKRDTVVAQETKVVEVTEKDILFDKGYKYPACDYEFKAKTVKVGKNKSEGHDHDLRPRFKIAD